MWILIQNDLINLDDVSIIRPDKETNLEVVFKNSQVSAYNLENEERRSKALEKLTTHLKASIICSA